ncbi:SRPBCC family protein [Anatilimnocola floriformis]|uniref:SRPBCC family protein n=1 Tax=Anatilimnocola floriformis TaxID=2948575 RepID=UPI0020C47BCC|nr:SRPBCC family protein [Anatilimnocola floriformis]
MGSQESNTDKIEKKTVLKASRDRVWQAISDSTNFGKWFGVKFDGPFVAGEQLRGQITPTQVDPEVAKMQEPYTGKPFVIFVDCIEPQTRFAFRWHPFAIDPNHDYSQEPMTLVAFELADAEGGTLLTITESGFDQIPIERRAAAFRANDGGWSHQSRLVEKYLAQTATPGDFQ